MTLSKEIKKVFRKVTNSHIDENGNVHCVLAPADVISLCQARELLERRERDKQEPVAWRKFVPCEWNSILDSYEYFDAPGKPGAREPLYAALLAADAIREVCQW